MTAIQKILAIETSCDDTSVAVLRSPNEVLSCVSQSQDVFHARHGGIVPEIASRNHLVNLHLLIESALEKAGVGFHDLDAFVATNRPGLLGSLIVGVVTAKTLAQVHAKPWFAVNHLEGHIWAPFLKDETHSPSAEFSDFVALAVSGGHTTLYRVNGFSKYEVLGTTRDDAAGEALDKFAKMVGLGFPGGPRIDQLSQTGNPAAYDLPRTLLDRHACEMSFSGLKSAGARLIADIPPDQFAEKLSDLCASFQEAVVDTLMVKLIRATELTKCPRVVLTGGVAANTRLRARVQAAASERGWQLAIPPLRYCTDNAAMIGFVGLKHLRAGKTSPLNMGPSPQSWPGDFELSIHAKTFTTASARAAQKLIQERAKS